MEETKRRKNVMIVVSILCIIIIILLVVVECTKKTPDISGLVQNIALSILCSLVASFIFLYVQRGIEKDQADDISQMLGSIDGKLKVQGELYDSGIKSIRKKSFYDKNDDFWKRIIQNADEKMDMIGHSLNHWLRDEYKEVFCEKIISMVNAEKSVRLILSCEEGEFDRKKVIKVLNGQKGKKKQEKKRLSKVESTYYELAGMLQDVDIDKKRYLEIYVADRRQITYLYIRTDNQCFISPYILSQTNSRNSFLLELETAAEYSRCFEEDFHEMAESMECIEWE